MPGKFLLIFSLPMLLLACDTEMPEIRSVCEGDNNGHYTVKWETFPPLKGTVRLYQSCFPDSFPNMVPIAEQAIDVGVMSVAPEANYRPYFKLVFDKLHSVYLADRIIHTQNVYNCRDIGGYYNRDKRQVKWGKIYRSGSFVKATAQDWKLLSQLNIKTVLDCRSQYEIDAFPFNNAMCQVLKFPLEKQDLTNNFIRKIADDEMRRGDVIIMQQDLYADLLQQNGDHLRRLFEALLDETNYPVIIYGSLGKDRAGLVVALILHALNVNKEQITQDYILSNSCIDFNKIVEKAGDFSYEQQEALTALLSANEIALEYARTTLNKTYGSVDNYLEKEVGLTAKKREKLSKLLLY